jgi:hypothetical protein
VVNTGAAYSPNISQTTSYWVSCTSAQNCEGPRTQVTGTINAIPAAPETTGDTRCGPGMVNLSASGCSGGTLKWYDMASGGTVVNTGATYSPNLSQTTSYWVSCTSAQNCEGPRTQVTGTIFTIPAAPGTTGDTRCGAGIVNLSASGCSGGTLKWYDMASGGTVVNTGATYSPNISQTTSYWVSCATANCEGPRTQVTGTVNAIPAAPGTTGDTRCGAGIVNLSASGCSGGILKWYDMASGGTVVNTGATYSPNISQTTSYWVSCTSAQNCEGPRTQVTGTVNAIPAAPGTTGDTRCGAGVVNLSASGCTGGTLKWYNMASGGSVVNTGAAYSPNISQTTSYWVSCTSAQNCEGPRTQVTGTINAIPAAPGTTGDTRCGPGIVNLSASGCSGGTLKWYDMASGGTVVNTGATYSPNLSQTTSYWVSCTSAQNCEGPRTQVTGTINPVPECSINSAPEGPQGPICIGEASPQQERTYVGPDGMSSYKWTVQSDVAGDIVIKNGIDNAQAVTLIIKGNGKLSLTVTNSFNCTSQCSKDVVITEPGTCIIDGPEKVCASSENVYTAGAGGVAYHWTIEGDATIVSSMPYGNSITVKAGATGSYTVKLMIDNGPFVCPSYCERTTVVEQCNGPLCSYTQGYYGNSGGIACTPDGGSTTKALIENSINNMPDDKLVLGSGLRRFVATAADANKIIAIMPGGGPAAILGNAPMIPGYWTPYTIPVSSQGKIRNILLAQTIALALNVYIPNSELGSFSLAGMGGDANKWLVTVAKTGDCAGLDDALPKECKFDPVYTWCESLQKNVISGYTVSYNPYKAWSISSKVINALPGDKTVLDLLNFASAILGGAPLPAGVSLSDVAGAAAAINEGFDECRIFVEFRNDSNVSGYCVAPQPEVCPVLLSSTAPQVMKPSFGTQKERPDLQPSLVEVKAASIQAFPNPFRETVNFRFVSPQSGRATLELFNVFGQRLTVLFDGEVKAHTQNNVRYTQSIGNTSMLIYKLTVNGTTLTGKVQSIK